MGNHQLNSLIKMINQIASNQNHVDEATAAETVSGHIQKFWSRGMKEQICDYLENDGAELSDTAKLSVQKLTELQKVS